MKASMVKQDRAHNDLERKKTKPGFAPFFLLKNFGKQLKNFKQKNNMTQ